MNPAGTVQRGCLESEAYGPRFREASLQERVRSFALSGLLIVLTLGLGWLVWTTLEWRRGRTASFRLGGLRIVRSNGDAVGWGRVVVRNAMCCTLLIVPTMVACVFVALAFVMGASPPQGLLSRPRRAPWDILTRTKVVHDLRKPTSDREAMRFGKWHGQVPLSVN